MRRPKKVKARKRLGERPGRRWMFILAVMPTPEELDRGMEIATTFEERHGGKPPMYFARYSIDNTIRITVLTTQDDKTLKKHLRRLGIHKVQISVKGGGSWEHCHAYQVAKHLFNKTPRDVQDVIHWVHNMCNYTYIQEVTNYCEMSGGFMLQLIKRPNEPVKKA